MPEEVLTFNMLQDVQNLAKKHQPFNKPVVGLIINGKAWRGIKEEMEKAFPTIRDFAYLGLKDKFCGAPVYEANISPTYAEVYFDKESSTPALKN